MSNRKQSYKRDCGACATEFEARSGSQKFCPECKKKIRTKTQDIISIVESEIQNCTDSDRLRKLEDSLEKLKNGNAGSDALACRVREIVEGMKRLPNSNRSISGGSKPLWRCGQCGALCTVCRCLECELKARFKTAREQKTEGGEDVCD